MLRIADEIEARETELLLTNTLENGSPVPRPQVEQLSLLNDPGPNTRNTSSLLDGEYADGLFIQPTVLVDGTSNMRVSREEIFGQSSPFRNTPI